MLEDELADVLEAAAVSGVFVTALEDELVVDFESNA